MTDNTSSENTTKVTQLKWIDIYTSRTYVQKKHNLILLQEFKKSMLWDYLLKQKTFTGRDGRTDRNPNII